MLLGAVGASATTSFTLPFVPQALGLANITTITNVRVTVLGDGVICDLDATGLANLKNTRQQGAVTSYVEIMLANGVVKNKTCLIEITNGVTASTAYHTTMANSGDASLYYVSQKTTVLAGAGTDFRKFAVLGLAASATTDYAIVTFKDGATQRYEQAEVRILFSKFQAVENNANDLRIDNIDGWIDTVTFYPTATQLVYVQSWKAVGVLVEGSQA